MTRLSVSRINLTIGFFLSLFIGYVSGWRDFGLDRAEYIAMYNGIVNSEEFSLKLWHAKDIFNLCVVSLSNYFIEDPRLAFLITCTLSIYLKYRAAAIMAPQQTALVLLLYALLLSPGLEFAAMRSGLAIGFIMLAAVNVDNKYKFYTFCILAVSSHISMIAVVVFMMPVINKYFRNNGFMLAVFSFGPLFASNFLIEIFMHGAAYKGSHGTVFAYVLPLITLMLAWLIFYDKVKGICISKVKYNLNFEYFSVVVFYLIAISFGFTAMIVTAATRYLEVAWCLMLFISILRWRHSIYNMLGCIGLILFLCLLNIERSTWLAIFDANFTL